MIVAQSIITSICGDPTAIIDIKPVINSDYPASKSTIGHQKLTSSFVDLDIKKKIASTMWSMDEQTAHEMKIFILEI